MVSWAHYLRHGTLRFLTRTFARPLYSTYAFGRARALYFIDIACAFVYVALLSLVCYAGKSGSSTMVRTCASVLFLLTTFWMCWQIGVESLRGFSTIVAFERATR